MDSNVQQPETFRLRTKQNKDSKLQGTESKTDFSENRYFWIIAQQ